MRSLVKYRVKRSKIKFVSTRSHVISSRYISWFRVNLTAATNSTNLFLLAMHCNFKIFSYKKFMEKKSQHKDFPWCEKSSIIAEQDIPYSLIQFSILLSIIIVPFRISTPLQTCFFLSISTPIPISASTFIILQCCQSMYQWRFIFLTLFTHIMPPYENSHWDLRLRFSTTTCIWMQNSLKGKISSSSFVLHIWLFLKKEVSTLSQTGTLHWGTKSK